MEEKVIKIKADIEGFMTELQKASSGVDNLEKKGEEGMNSFDNSTKTATSSIQKQAQEISKRNADVQKMLKDEMQDLTELKARRDRAFGTKEIREYDRRIQETGRRIKAMGGTFNELKSVANMNLREMQLELRKLRTTKFDNLNEQEIAGIKNRMATLTDGISDFRKQVKVASADNIPALVNGFHGIISAVQITVGALSLFGIENEKLQKATVQLISVSQGLSQLYIFMEAQTLQRTRLAIQNIGLRIKETYATISQTLAIKAETMATEGSTIATRLFGKALNGLPLIAIISGVVALVSALGSLAIYYYNNNKALKENSNEYIKQQATIKINNEINNKATDIAADRINSIKVLSERIKGITNDDKKRNKLIDEYNELAESAGGKTIKYGIAVNDLNTATRENINLLFIQAKAEAAIKLSKDKIEKILKNEIKLKKLENKQKEQENILTKESNVNYEDETGAQTVYLAKLEKKLSKTKDEIDIIKNKNKILNTEWKELMKIVTANEDLLVIEEEKAKEEKEIVIDKNKELEEIATMRAENIRDEQSRELELLKLKHKKELDEIITKYGNETELIKLLKIKQNNELLNLDKKYKDEEDKLKAERIEKDKQSRELQRQAAEDYINNNIKDINDMYDEIMNTEGLKNSERKELLKQFMGENSFLYKQGMDEIKQKNIETFQSILDVGNQLGGAISGIFNAMASNAEEGSEKEKQARKKAAIAELAITQAVTIAEISKAIIAQQNLLPPANIIEAIRIGAMGATAIANIIKSSNDIKKMKEGGSGIFNGPSHAKGGIRFGNTEVEGGESYWVLSKAMTPKYAPIMQQVFDDIQTGKIEKEQNIFSPNIELNDEYTRKMYEIMSNSENVNNKGKYIEQRQGNRTRRIYN